MMTEWSMTSSTGTSGLTCVASPPRRASASRMAARSTTPGTPVKSCMSTRSGVKAISWAASPAPWPWPSGLAPQAATATMSSAETCGPSSWRSRFSRRTLMEYGSRAMSWRPLSAGAVMLKIS